MTTRDHDDREPSKPVMEVRTRIIDLSESLTAAERKLSTVLLSDYPFAGLETIQALAARTKISPPSISRFVTKLGFAGYLDFQRSLIDELKESQRSPIDLHDDARTVEGTFLEDFLRRAGGLMAASAQAITSDQFERVCAQLADEKRNIFVLGGRISDAVAFYLSRHLRQIRSSVFHLPPDPEVWPEYLLRMRPRDVLFLVDFRRYQASLTELAARASGQHGARVIVVTDKWLSPISGHSADVLAVPIESGTVWDSYAPAFALMEAIVTRIAEENWDQTRKRIQAWDAARLPMGEDTDDR